MKFKKIIVFCLLVTVMQACSDKFLDVKPKGLEIASSINDYNNMLEYSEFTQLTSPNIFLNTWHILGDDVAGLEPQYSTAARFGTPGTRNPNLFEWAKDVYRPDEETEEVSGFYKRIYSANKIINEVGDAPDGTQEQKDQYKAEALCHRAFAYFNLVNFFGKPYEATTAASDLGVPLVYKADFEQKEFVRASVKAVYDLVIDDLNKAIPYLPLAQNSSNRFCKAAAEALLGKVYLFTGDAEQAAGQLDKALIDLPANFTLGGYIELIDYITASVSPAPVGYTFIGPHIGSTAAQGNGYPETLQGQLAAGIMWLNYGAPLIVSPETYQLYQASDLRLKLFSNAYSIVAPGPGPLLPTGLYRSKAGFIGSSIGVQLPDIYLLRAEAKARINELDAARESLLALRSKRIPAKDVAVGIPTGQKELIHFIIDERRREFATLGFRWFDMRRLSVDPLFSGTTYTHTLYDASGAVESTYTLSPDRWVLRFSEKLMTQSPGLVNNP